LDSDLPHAVSEINKGAFATDRIPNQVMGRCQNTTVATHSGNQILTADNITSQDPKAVLWDKGADVINDIVDQGKRVFVQRFVTVTSHGATAQNRIK